MELIIINENKLKIMLSAEDMKKYGLFSGGDELSFPNAKHALQDILQEVRHTTGFEADTEKDRIFVQVYPSLEGGCEMFVTKMGLLCQSDRGEEIIMPAYKEQNAVAPRSTKKSLNVKRTTLTYCFEKLDWMLCACRELKRRRFCGESALYRDKEGRYYLLICQGFSEDQKSSPSCFLSEFGELENTEHARLYINENGYCICNEGAVEIMSEL